MSKLRRVIALIVATCLAAGALPAPAQAAMLATDVAIARDDHARVAAFFDRAEARHALAAYGITEREAKARVAALSDEETAKLAAQIDRLPAGGDAGIGAVVGAALIVFLVLLLTDILGFTHVFPFTKPVRR